MAADPICLRLPPDMLAMTKDLCAAQNISVSEWIRMLINDALHGNVPDVNEGYMQARALALKLSHELLRRATEMLPPTYEEAQMYFGLAGPGRGHHG